MKDSQLNRKTTKLAQSPPERHGYWEANNKITLATSVVISTALGRLTSAQNA